MPSNRQSGVLDFTALKYNWRGEWSTAGIYSKNDIVRFNGRTYFCNTDLLFEQGLAGPAYGPANILITGDGYTAGEVAPTTWNMNPVANIEPTNMSPSALNGNYVNPNTNPFGTQSYPRPQPGGFQYGFRKSYGTSAAWDTSIYSVEYYNNSAYISAQAPQTNAYIMFGFTTQPTVSNSYSNINYAWYYSADTTLQIYESGSSIGSFGTYTASTKCTITYDGKYIRYIRDGIVWRTVDRTVNTITPTPLYAQAAFYTAGNGTSQYSQLSNITYGSGRPNAYWTEHTDGFLFRGGWMAMRKYYPGDIVKLRGDVYLCKNYNYNGHPLYKNGYFPNTTDGTMTTPNPDWKRIGTGIRAMDDKYVEMLPNMNPLGWTKYPDSWGGEPGKTPNQQRYHFFTASGKVYLMGEANTNNNNGSGIAAENGTQWIATPAVSMVFELMDYKYGRLPGYQGQPPKCIQLVCNDYWGMALFDNGELYHWGYGGAGNTGDGGTSDWGYPRRVGYVNGTHYYQNSGTGAGYLATTRIVKIGTAPGGSNSDAQHSCIVLDSNGSLWSWGYNGYGQLGLGSYANYSVPTKINQNFFEGVQIVDCWNNGGNTYSSTFALDANGQLWACGYNGYGQLGTGNTRNEPAFRLVQYNWNRYGGIKKVQFCSNQQYGASYVLTNDGTFHACGRMSNSSAAAIGTTQNQGYIQVFRPYPNMMTGNLLPPDGTASSARHDYQSNILNNLDNFWVVGMYSGDNNTFIFKEKNTGVVYGMGYNPNNCMALLPQSYLNEAADGYYTSRNYYPLPININMPDLVFVGGSLTETGSKTLAFVMDNGKVYTSGANDSGSGGWGWDGQGLVGDFALSGMNEYDTTFRSDSNKTYFGMRQTERIAICNHCYNESSGAMYLISENQMLMYIGYNDVYALAGYNKWPESNNPGAGKGSYYLGRGNNPNQRSTVRVMY
jgi:alpha-tubulin suppressor-like RCC1 family protein